MKRWVEFIQMFDPPIPRVDVVPYTPVSWPVMESLALSTPVVNDNSGRLFFDVVESRRSQRQFDFLDQQSLSNLLWHTARQQAAVDSEFGFPQQLRPVMSGGACHPIHLLVVPPPFHQVWRYSSSHHKLELLLVSKPLLDDLVEVFSKLLPLDKATLFLFAAESGKSAAKYINSETIIWRDSGALLQQLALVAEALFLNFCALGETGNDFVSRLDSQCRLTGVGACLIGARP